MRHLTRQTDARYRSRDSTDRTERQILLDRGWAPYDVLTKTPVESVHIDGIDFRDGILFVREVLNVDGKGAEIIALPVPAAFATSSPCSAGGTGAGAAAPGRRPNKVGCRCVAGVPTALNPSTS
jgi:hypothetical protein